MSLPRGPRTPRAVQTWQWLFRPTEFLKSCGERYGEIFTIRLYLDGNLVVTTNADAIKQVFAASYEDVWQPKSEEFPKLLGPSSLFVLEGQGHLRMRRMVTPALNHDRMQRQSGLLHDLAEDAIDSWPIGVPFKLQEAMQALTLQTTLQTLLGNRCGPRLRALSDLYAEASAQFATPFMLLPIEFQRWIDRGPWPRLVRITKDVREVLRAEIRERRSSSSVGGIDVLSTLIEARDPDGRALTDEDLEDTLITLLVAGHDTTANALSWALCRLLEEPGLCERLREELRGVVDGGGGGVDRFASLPLLDATVREVLRLHPIFPGIRRNLRQPMNLLGYELPIGTPVVPCIYLAQRRPDVFPDPERFLPDRFLDQKPSPYEWFPFGGGVRRCVGNASVPIQMKVVLATILGRTRLQPVAGPPVRTVRAFISLAPSGGVPAILVSRSPRRSGVESQRVQLPA